MSVRLVPTRIQAVALVVAGLWIFMMAGIPDPVGDIFQIRENPMEIATPHLAPFWKTIPEKVLAANQNMDLEVRMRVDPLGGSLLLFAIPSFLLAMVSPCAIRALTRRVEESGRMSGSVFALGSLGSIAGVMVTSFWLIAMMGLGANLRLIGFGALLLGLVAGLIREGRRG